MIYNNLILNKRANQKILSYFKSEHLPNAFIFYGNNGIGKEAHAVEYFALFNCQKPNENLACGNCSSCKKTKIFQHELLNIIVPLPKGKSINKNDSYLKGLTDKQKNELILNFKEKGQHPYHKIKLDNANTIIINSIKEIKNSQNIPVSKSKKKLHIIFDADKLCFPNQESANALLKILEEPKENNLFILVTSKIHNIIDTILSRCTPIFFTDLKTEEINNFLCSNGLNSNEAKIISKISQGNVRYALQLKNTLDKKLFFLKNMFNSLINNNINEWNKEFKNLSKEEVTENLTLLMFFFRDIQFLSVKQNDSYFIDFHDTYKILLNKFPNAEWTSCIKEINNAQNYILRNGHIPLIITSLYIEIQNILSTIDYSIFQMNDWLVN